MNVILYQIDVGRQEGNNLDRGNIILQFHTKFKA